MRKKTIETIPTLTEKMHDILNTFSKSRTLPAGLVKRSKIILMSAAGDTNQKISVKVGLHYDNVATWRNRFLANLPKLKELEGSVPEKLSDEIARILSDEKRTGVPSKFTPEQIMKIIDLACKDPQKYGYEVSQKSVESAAFSKRNNKIRDCRPDFRKNGKPFLKIKLIYSLIKYGIGYIPLKKRRIRRVSLPR